MSQSDKAHIIATALTNQMLSNAVAKAMKKRSRNDQLVHVVECFELNEQHTRVAVVGMCFDTRFEAEMYAASHNGRYIGEKRFGDV